jgi:thymidylate synthase (FAD)
MTQIITQLNPDVLPTGSDLGIVNAARKSFGRRSEWDYFSKDNRGVQSDPSLYTQEQLDKNYIKVLKDKDKRLLEFLARGMTAADFGEFVDSVARYGYNAYKGDVPKLEIEFLIESLWQWRNTPTHDTPFNHGFFSFEVKAPIFVARHLVKHEYLIMSEYSRRYITDDVEFYTPEVWRKAAADVKQGSSDEAVNFKAISNTGTPMLEVHANERSYTETMEEYVNEEYKNQLEVYKRLLAVGVAPEQARMVLPQSLMTSWTWSGTLGAFSNMCKLRLSSDTQAETRVVAQAVYEELKKQFPVAAPLLVEGVI